MRSVFLEAEGGLSSLKETPRELIIYLDPKIGLTVW